VWVVMQGGIGSSRSGWLGEMRGGQDIRELVD